MYDDVGIELIELLDLMDFTFSSRFVEKHRHKYSENFIKLFQLKLMESWKEKKPLKLSKLFNFLNKRHQYSREQITQFLQDIEIDLYYPLVSGRTS